MASPKYLCIIVLILLKWLKADWTIEIAIVHFYVTAKLVVSEFEKKSPVVWLKFAKLVTCLARGLGCEMVVS